MSKSRLVCNLGMADFFTLQESGEIMRPGLSNGRDRHPDDNWSETMTDRESVIKELTNLPTTIYDGFYQLRITHDLRDKVITK